MSDEEKQARRLMEVERLTTMLLLMEQDIKLHAQGSVMYEMAVEAGSGAASPVAGSPPASRRKKTYKDTASASTK